jgi:phosphopantothenoylcysteine decarboxylase / phosphopantothenate---cysteine ligase
MGMALANAALRRQWPVTLLLGPVPVVNLPEHSHMKVERFHTAADLHSLLHLHWPSHDLLLMAAAVADYTPVSIGGVAVGQASVPAESLQKVKRSDDRLTLELSPTPDLLASIASMTRNDQMTIGFALEPAASLDAEAKGKLQVKRLDAIVANPLETMDAPNITATLLWRDGRVIAAPPAITKEAFAAWLLEQIAPALRQR